MFLIETVFNVIGKGERQKAYKTHGGNEKCIKFSVGKPEGRLESVGINVRIILDSVVSCSEHGHEYSSSRKGWNFLGS